MDTSGAVYRKAAETVRSFYQCAAGLQDEDKRQKLASWALKCESRAKLEAMLALAQNQAALIIQPEELDSDPWLFCVQNGVLDLRTGQPHEHTRADLISKLSPVVFDPDAKARTFERFLDRNTRGSAPLLEYLQRFAGYCLTGNTREQIMAVWHGLGANGKSTLQNCLLELLGDYGATTPSETLMVRHGSPSIPNDVARLQGIRLAAAFETGTNSRLNEGLIKQATGGDRLAARFLHAEFFEFTPQFKIILSCNHKPRIIGTDNGIWRRVHMVSFDVTIPEPERDKELPEKLRAELPGVLNWALAGCLEWQKRGLDPPPEVKTATENYRQEMDSLGVFMTERCELNCHGRASSSQLYAAYKIWAESAGERAVSQRMLGSLLKERGFESRRSGSSGGYEWHGISLKKVQLVQ